MSAAARKRKTANVELAMAAAAQLAGFRKTDPGSPKVGHLIDSIDHWVGWWQGKRMVWPDCVVDASGYEAARSHKAGG